MFGLLFLASLFLAETSSAKIENNVSATAVSGGNVVTNGGTVKIGDAQATVSAENYVNSGENVKNTVEARAEAQGAGAKASVEVNGEKKSCVAENGESCSVEINNVNTDESMDAEKVENKNIIQITVSAIYNFTKNITQKIVGWFS